MCGIGGVYNPNKQELDLTLIEKLLEVNKSRGVYSFGYVVEGQYLKTPVIEAGIEFFLQTLKQHPYDQYTLFQFRTPTVEVKEFIMEENPPFNLNEEWFWVANTTSNAKWWKEVSENVPVKNDAWFLGYSIRVSLFAENEIYNIYKGPFAVLLVDAMKNEFYVGVSGYPLYYYVVGSKGPIYFSSVALNKNWKPVPQNKIFKVEKGGNLKEVMKVENEDVPWLI